MTNKPIIEAQNVKSLKISVVRVFKASFNDTYWLEDFTVNLNELQKDELAWFDPYNGRGNKNATRIAVAYCSDEKLVILEKTGDEIKKQESTNGVDAIISEDFDEYTFIAAHISMQ